MKCKCGANVGKTYKFCPMCGEKLEVPVKTYTRVSLLPLLNDDTLMEVLKTAAAMEPEEAREYLFKGKIPAPKVYVITIHYYDKDKEKENRRTGRHYNPHGVARGKDVEWFLGRWRHENWVNITLSVTERYGSPSTMADIMGLYAFKTKADAEKALQRVKEEIIDGRETDVCKDHCSV